MFQNFYPNEYLDSVYKINFNKLKQEGIKGILFDIDNTLVPHGEPADEKVLELFQMLKQMGIQTCLISNNKEPRVKPFATLVNSPYLYDAHKPSIRNYIEAMKIMGTDKGSTIFVGDQLFTDIYGANRAGIPTILVEPIHPKEEIQIVLKRYLEKIVLYFYRKNTKKKKRYL